MCPRTLTTAGLVVLVAMSLVAGTGVGVQPPSTGAPAVGADALQADEPLGANNTTPHVHPDRASGRQDLLSARAWLGGRMALQLQSCVVDVGVGSTDVCALEDEYPDWLKKYVDIARETSDDDDDRRAESFERTREDHREYSESVSSFSRTYREYQEAREDGNDARARQLARELQRQATAIDATHDRILRDYGIIEEEARVDLEPAREEANQTVENVTEIVEEIEAAEFVATELSAYITPRQVSFLEPGTVSGRLVTEDGSAVGDAAITLAVGDREIDTRTDQAGRFTVEYRPTTQPVGADRLDVRYEPANESPYLGSNATVDVMVQQVEPVVRVSVEPTTAAFGDELRVTGSVTADGIGAPGVPVVVTLDGRQLAEVTTDDDGTFAATTPVRAADGPGDVEIRAAYPLEDRALAPAAATTSASITETETALTIEASAAGPASASVEGQLVTDDGRPVPDQPVTIRVNGTAVETARTDSDGRYDTTVTVPERFLNDQANATVMLMARYDASGTNLGPSAAETTVVLPAPAGGDGAGFLAGIANAIRNAILDPVGRAIPGPIRGALPSTPLGWLAGFAAIATLVVIYLARRRGAFEDWFGPDADDHPPEPESVEESDGSPTEPEPARSPLDPARARLGTDADGAVMLAYSTVRESLAQAVGPSGRRADTHWEFLAACRGDGLDEQAIAGLERLTETYERAAFAPAAVSQADAESALADATALV